MREGQSGRRPRVRAKGNSAARPSHLGCIRGSTKASREPRCCHSTPWSLQGTAISVLKIPVSRFRRKHQNRVQDLQGPLANLGFVQTLDGSFRESRVGKRPQGCGAAARPEGRPEGATDASWEAPKSTESELRGAGGQQGIPSGPKYPPESTNKQKRTEVEDAQRRGRKTILGSWQLERLASSAATPSARPLRGYVGDVYSS